MTQRVFVDANIFVSRTIMDWLFHMRMCNDGMFQLHSTEDVFVEALHAMRKRNPRASGDLLTDRIDKIRRCVDEVLPTFPGNGRFSGTDDGDYHVHAAAIASGADMILTNNSPSDITTTPDEEPYEIITADEFFLLVHRSNPHCLPACTQRQFDYWSAQGKGQLDDALTRAGCPTFAAAVRRALQVIALSR